MDCLKRCFRPLRLAMKRKMTALSDQSDIFGTIVAATHYHDIGPAHPCNTKGAARNADDLMAQLDGHFDNLSLVFMNSNITLDQLTTTPTDQYAEIMLALNALAATPHNNSSPMPRTRTRAAALPFIENRKLERRLYNPQAAIKNNWKMGLLLHPRPRCWGRPRQQHLQ